MTWSLGAGLEGKGVIVTGAAGGIGRPVVEAFATTGARIMALDLEQDKVDEVVAGLEGSGHVAIGTNLADIHGHDALVARAVEEFGNLYVIVNLAAVLRRRNSIDDVTEEDWDLQHDLNLKAAFFLCRSAGHAMIEGGNGGRIITFTSQAWWSGSLGGGVAYAASKGGVVSMTRGLARSFGPHGITVNSIAPGQVHTPMLMTGLAPEDLRIDEGADAARLRRRAGGPGGDGRLPGVRPRSIHHGGDHQPDRRIPHVLRYGGLAGRVASTSFTPAKGDQQGFDDRQRADPRRILQHASRIRC